MEGIDGNLFWIAPLLSLLCNMFLFASCLGAKKDSTIRAFMFFLLSAVIWSGGSFFLRFGKNLDVQFWSRVAMVGIFLVPLMFYNFVYCYSGQKNKIVRCICWVVLTINAAANLWDFYLKEPVVEKTDGMGVFHFDLTPWAIGGTILLAIVILYTFSIMISCIKKGTHPAQKFTPIMVGVAIMFLGVIIQAIPKMGSFPSDSMACTINAILLYKLLYQQRLLALKNIFSERIAVFMSAVFTTTIMIIAFPGIQKLSDAIFPATDRYNLPIEAIASTLLAIILFYGLRKTANDLFIKSSEEQDNALKQLGKETTKLLSLEEILFIYKNFLKTNFNKRQMHICLYNHEKNDFRAVESTADYCDMQLYIFRNDYPIIEWMRTNQKSLIVQDFKRTAMYKAMWDNEKQQLKQSNTLYIVPIAYEKELIGVVFCEEGKNSRKTYSVAEIDLMESAASLVSMAIKSNLMSAKMRDDALRDTLTGLYNRQTFMEKARQEFELAKFSYYALLLISLDDFRLFNELYGSMEADYVLKRLGEVLRVLTSNQGLVGRTSGKEFMISLPFYDVQKVRDWLENSRKSLNRALVGSAGPERRSLTFSAGICVYPTDAKNFEELNTNVNLAVFAAKRNGKNQVKIHSHANRDDLDQKKEFKYKQMVAENCTPTVLALAAAVDARDHYTFNHSLNVSEYAAKLAAAISLDNVQVEVIRQAGLMHDIGKIGLSDDLLLKKAPLTAEEYEIVKQHVESSVAMIRHIPSLDYVVPVAIGHHERWDGQGYPRGLVGDEIPIGARCLGLADAFDAMTTDRPYRPALSVDRALMEIEKNLKHQFDPELGRTFIQLVRAGEILSLRVEVPKMRIRNRTVSKKTVAKSKAAGKKASGT